MNDDNLLSMFLIMLVLCVAMMAFVASCQIEPEPKTQNYFFYQGYAQRSLRPATYEELKAAYDDIYNYYFEYYTAISRGEEPNKRRPL